ncbi:hypothetical protein HS088_TW03G00090 [Tripterygium wilfordii]|uniref:AP180 N-terminal homology (ANTH) domain-containing protein n=1 Tax=Tripterygium wilfordii TaxID=458696 RepID=A0A7J7DTR8_TRIWF|nr:hypothetical protein HS088_TW03G00090 [Tripterygium wilfordii]
MGASQSKGKAAVISYSKKPALNLPIAGATTQNSFNPPNQKYLNKLISYGHSSRATATAAIDALRYRLQITRDCSIALQCLITVHHINQTWKLFNPRSTLHVPFHRRSKFVKFQRSFIAIKAEALFVG